MCTTLHPNELKRLQDAFKRLDRNGDGTITAREFQIACRQFNPSISEMEIRKLVGQVSYNFFVAHDMNELEFIILF